MSDVMRLFMEYKTFDVVLKEISEIWKESPLGKGEGEASLQRLQIHIKHDFPPELKTYIRDMLPPENITLRTVGNPITIYGSNQLSHHLSGYNFNDVTNEPILDWKSQWFLIGDEGGDPIIVDLGATDNTHCEVRQALHGSGKWDFYKLASSLPQFTLLATLQHYALTQFGDVILDDEDGFRLREDVAEWYFSRIKQYDLAVYKVWTQHFENS